MKILAIETSCDETAAAIIATSDDNVKILSNIVASQIPLHQKYGGVFPEIASRAHSEQIINVTKKTLGKIKPDMIAVTNGPGLIGSLLIGTTFAKTYTYANNIPIVSINHLMGHIYANWAKKPHPQFPALILIVSGGHTGLYLMKSHCDIKTLGETLDDAAGEAFDKVAKILGLGYPGGPAISAEAKKYQKDNHSVVIPANAGIQSNLDSKSCPQPVWNDNIKFPRSMLDRDDYNFSFSGLKTSVLYTTKKLESQGITTAHYKSLIAYEFEQAVIDILIGKTFQASLKYKPKSICLCGGVSANQNLREQFKYNTKKLAWKPTFHCPPFELTTDNAAMIGLAAAYQTINCNLKPEAPFDITTDSNLKL